MEEYREIVKTVDGEVLKKVISEAIHNGWMKWMESLGYEWGPVRDEEKRKHPHFIPWEGLPDKERRSAYAAAEEVIDVLEGFDLFRIGSIVEEE